MQIVAEVKYARISPKKVRTIIDAVKKLRLEEALNVLTFYPKKGSKLIKEAVLSAVANGKANYNIEKSNLFIKNIIVTQGPVFKRFMPVSRGSAHGYKKRTSHIKVILEQIKPLAPKVKTSQVDNLKKADDVKKTDTQKPKVKKLPTKTSNKKV